MRVKLLFVAAAILAILGSAAATRAQQRIDLDLSASPGQSLSIDLESVRGSIEIVGTADDSVTIRGDVSARRWSDDSEVIVDQTSSGVSIYTELGRRDRDRRRLSVDLVIRVPRRFDIEINGAMDAEVRGIEGSVDAAVANNDLTATDITGEARLAVANGNLHVSNVSGRGRLSAVNGTITANGSDIEGSLANTNGRVSYEDGAFSGSIDSTNGSVRIERCSGDIEIDGTNTQFEVGDVAGSIDGNTTNGNVEAGEVTGDIRFETTNGSVVATLVGEGAGGKRVDVETLNGGVELTVAPSFSATFDLEVRQSEARRNTNRPEIRSDFPLDMKPGEMRGDQYRRSATGTTGSGSQQVEIRATNGDIVIHNGG